MTTIVREVTLRYGRQRKLEGPISNSRAAAKLFCSFVPDDCQESFLVVCVDAKNKAVGWKVVAIGTTSRCQVDVGAVFRPAIALGASGVIVAHNHPSGDCTPSREDLELTRRLDEAGALLGIRVLDHLVLGHRYAVKAWADGYTSLRDKGLWPERKTAS